MEGVSLWIVQDRSSRKNMHPGALIHALWFAKTSIKLFNNRVDPARFSWFNSPVDISVEDLARTGFRIEIYSQNRSWTWQRAKDSRYISLTHSCSHQKGQWPGSDRRQLIKVWHIGLIKTALSNKGELELLSIGRKNDHENNCLTRMELLRFPPVEWFPNCLF